MSGSVLETSVKVHICLFESTLCLQRIRMYMFIHYYLFNHSLYTILLNIYLSYYSYINIYCYVCIHAYIYIIITGRLMPVYTTSQRKLKVIDVLVSHRRSYKTHAAGGRSPAKPTIIQPGQALASRSHEAATVMNYEVAGVPFTLQCESFRSCGHFYTHLVEQAMRYATPAEMQGFLSALCAAREKSLSDPSVPFEWPREALPFTIR